MISGKSGAILESYRLSELLDKTSMCFIGIPDGVTTVFAAEPGVVFFSTGKTVFAVSPGLREAGCFISEDSVLGVYGLGSELFVATTNWGTDLIEVYAVKVFGPKVTEIFDPRNIMEIKIQSGEMTGSNDFFSMAVSAVSFYFSLGSRSAIHVVSRREGLIKIDLSSRR